MKGVRSEAGSEAERFEEWTLHKVDLQIEANQILIICGVSPDVHHEFRCVYFETGHRNTNGQTYLWESPWATQPSAPLRNRLVQQGTSHQCPRCVCNEVVNMLFDSVKNNRLTPPRKDQTACEEV